MRKRHLLGWGLGLSLVGIVNPSIALPPAEDTPEEVLRTQIILEARSPIDGTPMTAAEYALLKQQLAQSPPPTLSSEVRNIIFLLRLRQFFNILNPF